MKYLRKGLLVVLMVIAVCCGCSRNVPEEKDVPISDITAKLLSDLTWVDGPLYQLNETAVSKGYAFDGITLDGCEVYTAATGSTAEEIAVVKRSDKKDISDVEEAMKTRIDKKKKQFENYVPEEMYKLENAVISTHGNYAALMICDEFDKADEVFQGCFE